MTKRPEPTQEPLPTRAALVSVATRATRHLDPDDRLEELAGLADAAGATVVLSMTQERPAPDAATLMGRGKAEMLALACAEARAELVILDNDLTPAQGRNLEKILDCRVIDRTELILDIFARRARTHEGRLQVELAQLRYRLPRLGGRGIELSRLGGGIGTRGPGETQLETDRRRLRQRVSTLTGAIAEVKRRREFLRARRRQTDVPVVALVGYTNAGKTTLFNRLTGATAEASDALFVTLDPLTRRVQLPHGRPALVSDTVGFIDRLPHLLVAAFHATLEEVAAADILLHVIDASMPDRERREAAVRDVLVEVGAAALPVVEVFNKVDQLSAAEQATLAAARPDAALVSARDGAGVGPLHGLLADRLALDVLRVSLELDHRLEADQRMLADVYRLGHVVTHVTRDDHAVIEADVPRRWVSRFDRKVPA